MFRTALQLVIILLVVLAQTTVLANFPSEIFRFDLAFVLFSHWILSGAGLDECSRGRSAPSSVGGLGHSLFLGVLLDLFGSPFLGLTSFIYLVLHLLARLILPHVYLEGIVAKGMALFLMSLSQFFLFYLFVSWLGDGETLGGFFLVATVPQALFNAALGLLLISLERKRGHGFFTTAGA